MSNLKHEIMAVIEKQVDSADVHGTIEVLAENIVACVLARFGLPSDGRVFSAPVEPVAPAAPIAARLATIEERINAFIAHADAIAAESWKRSNYHHALSPVHKAEFSSKWCKIVTYDRALDGTERKSSVYCFVCLEDGQTKTLGRLKRGDIHKAASYNAPAKHARGNVFTDNFNNCAGPHGVAYLR